MKQNDENSLILRVIEYGKDKDGFLIGDMFENLKLNDSDKKFIEYKLCDFGGSDSNPNHILGFNSNANLSQNFGAQREHFITQNEVRILPNALFSYIDHLEIIEARKAAKSARTLSWIAIIISLLTGIGSLIIGYFQLLMAFNSMRGF